MCCTGCESVARTIVAAGLERYYQHREVPAAGPAQAGSAVQAAHAESAAQAGTTPPLVAPALPSAAEEGSPATAAAAALAEDENFERLAARRGYLQPAAEPGQLQACLMVDGMRCGACVWLLERGLGLAPGVSRVQANYAQQQALVQWDASQTNLARILAALRALGYRALPFDPRAREVRLQSIERLELRQLFVAGLAMMQVMMLQAPLYWAHVDDVDPLEAGLLHWASLVITLAALLYSGWPLLRGAVRDVVHRHLGMDVPVALGLLAAYLASAVNTWRGSGEVYFDTVTMFIFLLLGARWLEARARRRSLRWLDRLSAALPQGIRRLAPVSATPVSVTPVSATPASAAPAAGGDAGSNAARAASGAVSRAASGPFAPGSQAACNGETVVLAEDLEVGDLIVLDPGASVPADALSLEDTLLADCSLLSGESEPQCFLRGSIVPSGAVIAQAQTVKLQVVRPAQGSTRADLQRLVARAGSTRPALAELADRAASHFIVGLLIFVAGVLGVWLFVNPERALDVAIAVLVVSCPCALSLAVPSAIAAVQSTLAQAGVLLQRGDGLERLAAVTDVVFDKTGTLTQGRPEVRQVELCDPALGDEATALRLALPLAQASPHPLSVAIARRAEAEAAKAAQPEALGIGEVRGMLGQGVEARILGMPEAPHAPKAKEGPSHASPPGMPPATAWPQLALRPGSVLRLGSRAFACPHTVQPPATASLPPEGLPSVAASPLQEVWLSVDGKALARWQLNDPLRTDAVVSLAALRALGLRLHMLSGDHQASVNRLIGAIAPNTFVQARGAQSPQDKWQAVAALQTQGSRVLMVGDGLNDAAVLAAADMSAAIGQASDLARLHAGAVVLSGRLDAVVLLIAAGRQAMRLMRQNIAWATLYNLIAIPAAALGWIPAWGAALGMSASSLLVVTNSLRGLSWKRSSS